MTRIYALFLTLFFSNLSFGQLELKPQYLKTQYQNRAHLLHFFDTVEEQSKVKNVIYITDKLGFDIESTHFFDSTYTSVIPGLANAYCIANQIDPPSYKSRAIGKWNYSFIHEMTPEKSLGIGGYVTFTNQSDAKLIFQYTTPFPKNRYRLKVLTKQCETSFDLKIIINGDKTYMATSKIPDDIFEVALDEAQIRSIEIRTVQNTSSQVQFILHGLYLEPINSPAIVVHQVPIIGGVFKGILKESLLAKHINEINPKLIVIDPGISHMLHTYNSYRTKSEMNKVLRDLKRWAAHASILCISPQEMYRYSYPLIETGVFTRDFKKVSFAQNAAFIDWYAASGAKGGAKKWQKNGLLQKNKVRLNGKGCSKKEQLISSAIKNAYEKVVNAQDSALIIPNYITDLSDSKEKKTEDMLLNEKPKRIVHQVGRGQNLYRISLAYDVQPEDIMRWNKLTNDQLNTGQRLIIFKDNKRKDIPAIPKIDQNHKSNKRVFHRVRSGQSLYSIAKKYKTTIASIKELNKLKSNTIGIGQLLRVK